MKKKLVLFIALLFVLNICITQILKVHMEQNFPYFMLDQEFDASPAKLDYLVLGHSISFCAVNDSILGHAFNLSTPGESFIETYYKLKYILEQTDKKASVILVPVNEYGFTTRKAAINSFYWKKYIDYAERGRIEGELSSYLSVYCKSKLFPYYQYPKYYFNISAYNKLHPVVRIPPTETSVEENKEIVRTKIKNRLALRRFNFDVSSRYLDMMLGLANKHKVNLIFIKYPMPRYYLNARMEFPHYTHSYLIKAANYPILNYENLFYGHLEYYMDDSHLSETGSIVFTQRLKEDIDSLFHTKKSKLDYSPIYF